MKYFIPLLCALITTVIASGGRGTRPDQGREDSGGDGSSSGNTLSCCDQSTPTCSDGSTRIPCSSGLPSCADGSTPQTECPDQGREDSGGDDSEAGDPVPTITDIAYSDVSERNVLDLYLTSAEGPNPLIIWTHGGGWDANDKSSINPGITSYIDYGYSVASISYRYSTDAPWPAPISDAKAAVRFLRANAATYDLDPNRFISMGQSAGGMLASMLGTSIGVDTFEDPALGNPDVSSAVQLTVTFYGPQDFPNQNVDLEAAGCDPTSGNSIGNVIDCIPITERRCESRLVEASPVSHVDGNEPPFMIIQGTADCTVAYGQAQSLSDALNGVGVYNELILVEGGTHTFGSVITGNYLALRRFMDGHMMVEQAIGDDAEVACTLPDPAEVDGYQYFYPNMLSGCTSKNCDNPVIMGPFSCTQSSTFFGTGLAQMNGCTADNPQVTFSGCEEVLLWNILANPSAFVIHGLAILGLFSTLAFFAQRVLRKGNYQAISKV